MRNKNTWLVMLWPALAFAGKSSIDIVKQNKIWLLILLAALSVENIYGQSCSTPFYMESRSGSGSDSKIGYPELCDASNPPKYYLNKTLELNASSEHLGDLSEIHTWVFDPPSHSINGSVYEWVYSYSSDDCECSPTLKSCNAVCDELTYWVSFETWGDPEPVSYSSREELSNEYSTGRIKENASGKADNDLNSSDWTRVQCPGEVGASASLASDEKTASTTKAKYRFKIPKTDPDTRYIFTWQVHVLTENADSSVTETTTTKTCSVDGNGGEATSPDQTDLDVDFPAAGLTVTKSVNTSEVKLQVVQTDSGGGSGGSGCGSCGGGSSYSAGAGSVSTSDSSLTVSLGHNYSGLPVGSLVVNPNNLVPATPAMLQSLGVANDITTVSNGGYLRQLMTSQVLVDVVSNSPSQYDIVFYDADNFSTNLNGGLYPVTANGQFLTWRIENPGGDSDTNNLRMIETRGTYSITNLITWSGNTIAFMLANGLKKVVLQKLWNSNESTRTEISSTYNQGDVLVYSKTDTYQVNAGSDSLVSSVEGTGINARTTSYSISSLQQTVNYPDGTWDTSTYDDSSRLVRKDWAGHYTIYDYTPLTGDNYASEDIPRTVTTFFDGAIISKQFSILTTNQRIEIQATARTANWNDEGNLYTTNNFDTNGRLSSVIAPDKTITWYAYKIGAAGRTNVISTGYWVQTGYVTNQVTTTIYGPTGLILSTTTTENGLLTASTLYSDYDALGRVGRIQYLDGTSDSFQYDCCGVASSIGRNGLGTVNTYNDLKQLASKTEIGAGSLTWYFDYDPLGHLLSTKRQVGASIITNSSATFDTAGHPLTSINALGGITTYQEALASSYSRTTTYPDEGTRIETYNLDGTLASITGTAVHGIYYEYGSYGDFDGKSYPYTTETKLNGYEPTTTYNDMAGRTVGIRYGYGSSFSQSFYNYKGQLWKQVDPDEVTTIYSYNAKGEQAFTAISMAGTAATDIDWDNDRITQTTTDVGTNDLGTIVRRTQNIVWLNDQSTGSLFSVSETSVDGLKSWQVNYGENNKGKPVMSSSITSITGSNRTTTATAPDGSRTVSIYSFGRLQSSARFDASNNPLGGTSYTWDAHGRTYQVTDARNGTTTYEYNDADQVNKVTTPVPGGGQPAEVTATHYNTMLQADNVTQSDGNFVTNVYLLTGELGQQSGSRTYPVGYGFDYAGRMQFMTNWGNFNQSGTARVTTWNYNEQRGWLTKKVYPNAVTGDIGTDGPSYDYTPAGRLKTRNWVRGVTSTYNWDTAGSLRDITYSDSTPGVTNIFDRLGRLSTVSSAGTTETLTYNLANELLSESFTGGILDGLTVTNSFDAYLRRSTLSAVAGSQTLATANYAYTSDSRLSTVSDGNGNSATYSYLANSPLVSQITFKQNGATRMTTTKQSDFLNRLKQISSVPGAAGVLPISFHYNYNSANQRTKSTLADGSYWIYEYDKLGQVTKGSKYFGDGTPVAGQQFGYAFDDIGNRTQTQAGGDASGANLRVANYTNNFLNQITSRDVPGYVDVMGASLIANTVTVNGTNAYRKGEYFRQQLQVNNTDTALWTNITVASGQSVTGNVFVAQSPEQFSYDADGNLTNDGRWSYVWDAENRLIGMTVNTNIGPHYQLTFAYDSKNRRIQKVVATNGVAISTNKFLYDGWNLVVELGPDNSKIRTYLWGSDLSGSLQGAGGVGGLLGASYYGSTTTNCFPAFDGNGNVMAYINAADGTVVEQLDYDPFLNVIRETGPMANVLPLLGSTKYYDWETKLYYYGYRYLRDGVWLSRDSLGEDGGMNLYGFAFNNPLYFIDTDGKKPLGPLAPNTLPTQPSSRDGVKSSGNNPVNNPSGVSDNKADGVAGAAGMSGNLINEASRNSALNQALTDCKKSQHSSNGSCYCCVVSFIKSRNGPEEDDYNYKSGQGKVVKSNCLAAIQEVKRVGSLLHAKYVLELWPIPW